MSWAPVSLPSQLLYPAVITGEQASSGKNFWVFTDNDTADVFNGTGHRGKLFHCPVPPRAGP